MASKQCCSNLNRLLSQGESTADFYNFQVGKGIGDSQIGRQND